MRLTRLLTMILLSPVTRAPLMGVALTALRTPFDVFWMPPAGAALTTLPDAVRRGLRRPPLTAARRCVERISSRDWSSLPDIMPESVVDVIWSLGDGREVVNSAGQVNDLSATRKVKEVLGLLRSGWACN